MRPVFFFPHTTILDCGASRTTLAVFSWRRGGRLRLENYATISHALVAGEEARWLEKTVEALQTLRAKVEPVGPVTVLLPPHVTLMKLFSTPRVKPAKRDKIINFESQQSIPYPLGDVVWDRLIAGESAFEFNVLLCAAKREVIDPLCAVCAGAGLTPTVLLPSVLALVGALRNAPAQTEPATPTLLINLGARSTTLVLLEQTGFQARSLVLGGGSVASPSAGESGGETETALAIRSFANRLVQEITRTLVHFRQPGVTESPLRVVITGGGARLPGLIESLATQLNVPVALLDVSGVVEIGPQAAGFSQDEHSSTLAELAGAAATQLKTKPAVLNLLPLQLRHQAGRRRLRPWLAVAAGLAVALLVPLIAQQRRVLAVAHAKNLALERELGPLRSAAARNLEKQQQLAERQRQQEAWRKLTAARAGWGHFLDQMQAKFIPAGEVWLERMQLLPPSHENAAAKDPVELPRRIAFSGLMRSKPGDDALARVCSLLEQVAATPEIAAVEGERFEPAAAGLLRFDFVVVLRETAPL